MNKVNLRAALGILLVAGFMGALGLLFWVGIPEANEQLITYMLGQLSGLVSAVVGYHYTMNALNVKASDNTGDLLGAMRAQAEAGLAIPTPQFGREPPLTASQSPAYHATKGPLT